MNAFLADFAEPYQWAAEYRGLGLQVVPGKAGEKRPLMSWVEFQNALVPASQFDRWYGTGGEFRQNRQMGLLTGLCSTGLLEGGSGLLVLDLDAHGVARGVDWWDALVETHFNGLEPETWRAVSGGGGLHIFFAGLAGRRCPTFKRPDLGVDARGQGGYVVVAPSIHPNGNAYEWVEGFEPWSIPLAWAPPELHDALDALAGAQGGSSAPREPTPTPASQTGLRQDDGRETKLAAMVWAAVVDLRRASPIRPNEAEQGAELSRLWDHYELTTRSRLPLDDRSNAERLEAEGRGFTELRQKWSYAMLQWDSKVAEAARIPKAEAPPEAAPATPATLGEWDGEPSFEVFGLRSMGEVRARPAPRRWVVANWIPQGEVTLLSSAPGVGKSLLAMQLGCATALGQPWLGLDTLKGSSLFVTCEDDDDEIDRRFLDVRDDLGAVQADFADFLATSRRHKENRLTRRAEGGLMGYGPYYGELLAMVRFAAPSLLILDTLADFYTGNENDRAEVSWFVKALLGGLIAESGGKLSILALGHTAKAEESEFSGSTAWRGSVRSHLWASKPEDAGPNDRFLRRAKANYAGGDDDQLNLLMDPEARVLRALGSQTTAFMSQLMQTVVNFVADEARFGRPLTSGKGLDNNIHRAVVKALTLPGQPVEAVREALQRVIQGKLIEKRDGQWRKRGQKA